MTFIVCFTIIFGLGIGLQEYLTEMIPRWNRCRAMKYRRAHAGFRQFKHY